MQSLNIGVGWSVLKIESAPFPLKQVLRTVANIIQKRRYPFYFTKDLAPRIACRFKV